MAALAAALLAALVLAGEPNGSAGSQAVVTAAGLTTVPRPDHVVVVVEENHSGAEIVGNANAPYITSLASQGANFTSSFAVTHPSQPNYLALFSGSTQGLADDSCPHTYTGPSLGDQLLAAGLTFTGYSESLPSPGYTGCTKAPYARKHSPWINFPAVPASANQPFTEFPTDFTQLPSVSFVIPNLQDDMHDGTVAQGDTWLQTNLGAYAQWARTHNSLLVVTFDEDDYTAANQIATVIVGERVAPGNYAEQINHYNVLRTIEDAFALTPLGSAATAAPITDIWSAPTGTAPNAAMSVLCTGLSCRFDGSASTDPDGSVVDWQWDFGDGTSASGASVVHAYPAGGRYTATLTVADDQGAHGTTSRTLSVTEPGAWAVDLFGRTVSGGLGTADVGGAWSLSGGTASAYSVASGTASLALVASGYLAGYLTATKRTDADVRAGFGLSTVPAGHSVTLELFGRRVSSGNDYDAKLVVGTDRSVTLRIARTVGGTETVLGSPVRISGLTYTAGQTLALRLQVSGTGTTQVRARVWPSGSAEPSTWAVSANDTTTALQAAGGLGVLFSAPSTTTLPLTARVSALRATPVTNTPPNAAFGATCQALSCTVDASASNDPDGGALTYAWDFGDGGTGTGVTATHGYPSADTYTITLTVTDAAGATATATRQVMTTPPPLNNPPQAAFTATCPSLTCAFDGGGSTDDEGVVAWTWDFGDNGPGGDGAQVSHTFAAPGSYTVALTVSDDEGATNTTSTVVTVADATFARDAFGRTVTKGFGTADLGGAWTTTGTAASFAVSPGVATITQSASPVTLGACLCGVTRTDADVRATFSLSAVPVGNSAYFEVEGRHVANRTGYAAKLLVNPDRSMTLRLVRVVSGTETIIAQPVRLAGATYSAGRLYVVRVQVTGTGTTTVRARAWSTLDSEPTGWLVTATDTTASLQAAGSTGVVAILPSSITNLPLTVSLTSFSAGPTTG